MSAGTTPFLEPVGWIKEIARIDGITVFAFKKEYNMI